MFVLKLSGIQKYIFLHIEILDFPSIHYYILPRTNKISRQNYGFDISQIYYYIKFIFEDTIRLDNCMGSFPYI